ncbi:MAG: Na/Pi cotransporter family protein, partial [Ruminococcaceae bacterium]|nr:Na/Pi cotransporter family protein [Oscillospiraceae bacterium]
RSAVLALIGIVMYMMPKSTQKRKDTATIMLAFAVLMFGMDIMSDAMKPLTASPTFQNLFIAFGNNPLLGVLVGAALTGIIQSSSASVGILQGFVTAAILSGDPAATAPLTFGALLPIIMGQNIGTCITASISAIGTNTNAKRASMIHLLFNIIGTGVLLTGFYIIDGVAQPVLFDTFVGPWGIPLAHTTMKIICVVLMMPASRLLEKLSCVIVRERKTAKVEEATMLDERLLQAPSVALERARILTATMAEDAVKGLKESLSSLTELTPQRAESIRAYEDQGDHYEDILGTYLVKLSGCPLTEDESAEVASLLHLIGDFERISDHAVNILESAEEIKEKNLMLTSQARAELAVLTSAVDEILTLSKQSFIDKDLKAAIMVEPLEQVIDELKEKMRATHIFRLQKNECTIEGGFVWNDLLTNLERISDHCSNIAGCVIDAASRNLNLHESLRNARENDAEYGVLHAQYAEKYSIANL